MKIGSSDTPWPPGRRTDEPGRLKPNDVSGNWFTTSNNENVERPQANFSPNPNCWITEFFAVPSLEIKPPPR